MKVIVHKITGQKIPLKNNLILTYQCNRQCLYCNIMKKIKHPEVSENSFDQIRKIVLEIKKNGGEQITLIGGEPLLHPEAIRVAKFIKQSGLMLSISTNCDHLEKNKKILDHLDLLITCIDGDETMHDSYRGKGNYKNVMRALSIPSYAKKIVTFVITNQNHDFIPTLLNDAKNKKYHVNFQPLFEGDLTRIEKNVFKEHSFDMTTRKIIFQKIISMKKDGYPIINSYSYLNQMMDKKYFRFKKCYQGELAFTIDPYGNVFQCYEDIDVENIRIEKGTNLNHSSFRHVMRNIKIKQCDRCSYGCYAQDNFLFSLRWDAMKDLIRSRI